MGSLVGRQGEHSGDEKKEQGIWQEAIKRGKKERKKESAVERQGSHRIERGKVFLKCNVQISLLFLSVSKTCHNLSL